MRHWLIKSEPDVYSIDALKKDGTTGWTGVRNYQARNTMRDEDLQALVAVARLAASVWVAQGGPHWLTANYPPENGFYVDREGVKD